MLLDAEDVRDSKNEIIVPKVIDKRFKINFLYSFIICIGIMSLNQFMKYLDTLPELINGSDVVFHIVQSLIDISSQLAVSFAAAILFLYVNEFINEKKRIDEFYDIRSYSLFMLYKHMEIICNIDSFKALNRPKTRLQGDDKTFLTVDLPILIECFENVNTETLKSEINNYLLESGKINSKKNSIFKIVSSFESDINRLSKYKNYSFYKNFKEDIEGLESLFEEVQGYAEIYNDHAIDKVDISFLVDYYSDFFLETVYVFYYTQRYILSIRHKWIRDFARMLG